MELFDNLPIAAIVNQTYFAVHGGISEKLKDLDSIDRLNRVKEPRDNTLLNDLLWSDPMGEGVCYDNDFVFNMSRGTGEGFGYNPVTQFLDNLGLKAIVRAHSEVP